MLILVTIFDGFAVADSPLFISLELILNLMIGVDFGCRIKLIGWRKYFRNAATNHLQWWNVFDAVVVSICTTLFVITLFAKTGAIKGFEEAAEETLLVMWSIWQTLRMILSD